MSTVIPSNDDLRVISWTLETSEELVEVHPGVSVPTRVNASGPCGNIPFLRDERAEGIDDVDVQIAAVFDLSLMHYRLASLCITAIDGREVNGKILRDIPPYRIMRWLLPRTFVLAPGRATEAIRRYVYRADGDDPMEKPELADVAAIYKLSSVVRDSPAKTVAEMFGFPTRTASNWIVRARNQGYDL